MDTPHGPATASISVLTRGIREYSLFQAVLLVVDRLREAHPDLDDEALYDRLEFQANPSLGFPPVTSIVWSFSKNTARCGRAWA